MQDFKMFATKADVVVLLMFFHVSDCQRRIVSGQAVTADKRYVVYLVKAPIASQHYAYWLCGGAIVSSQFVITSAACVKDVDYLYVVAGYRKYIPDYQIATDPCTKATAKRVIYTCSPKGYQLKYNELDYWSYIDIALVKVETPYDFNSKSYTELCSYKPNIIPINYDTKYIEPGTDSMVFGWGHTRLWRKPGDTKNGNSDELMYAPTLILNKTVCIDHYDDYANMSQVIDKYMICTLASGNLDDKGNTIKQIDPLVNGCTRTQMKVMGFEGESCENDEETNSDEFIDYLYYDRMRRDLNQSDKDSEINVNETEDTNSNINEYNGRRFGICQNDHGGPLITWVGSREVLIGVASVFKVSEESDCMGPYLYTSTVKCSLFLECVLNTGDLPESGKPRIPYRRDLCDKSTEEKGFETIERYISWDRHHARPAHSKRHEKRERYKYNVARENYGQHKVFENVKHTEFKKFPVYERNRYNDRNIAKQKNIADQKYQATERNTGNGRYLYKALPKLVRPENNRIAMRPLLPFRN